MTNVICNVMTENFSNSHENVNRIRLELKSGIMETYSNHQDLVGTISLGTVEVEEIIDEKPAVFLYVVQTGVVTVDNSKTESIEKTIVDIYASTGIEITKDLTYEDCKIQYEGNKKELASIFKLIDTEFDDFEDHEIMMESQFYPLEKEISFWDKVQKIVKERE